LIEVKLMSQKEALIQPPEPATTRQCIVQLVNNYGFPIEVLEFKHVNGINDWSIVPGKMNNGDVGPGQRTVYQTGAFSATDHWYVKFRDNTGSVLDNDPAFDCSMEPEDEGKIVYVRIGNNLKVEMKDGDMCEKGLKRA
jgi:hypothetical protein